MVRTRPPIGRRATIPAMKQRVRWERMVFMGCVRVVMCGFGDGTRGIRDLRSGGW